MGIKERLDQKRPIVLDGATATELQRHGMSVAAPWWTTEALLTDDGRRLLRDIHQRYAVAGAEVLTANTFRTNRRTLERAGAGSEAADFVHRAVSAAKWARDASPRPESIFVAGSMAPVEDCYQPKLVPGDDELRDEHDWLAKHLAEAGVDLVMVETMNCMREAVIALQCARQHGLPALVSFVCADGDTLLSGERLVTAARAAEANGATAVLVNCVPPSHARVCVEQLHAACSVAIGVYPNIEDRSAIADWQHIDRYVTTNYSPEMFARVMAEWLDSHPIGLLGGCCGSTPEHIAAVREILSDMRSDAGAGRSGPHP